MHFLGRSVYRLVHVNRQFKRILLHDSIVGKTSNEKLKSWQEIPGPLSLPLVGQLLNFLPGGPLDLNTDELITDLMYKLYGPIVRLEGHFGAPPIIILYDAEAIAQILRSENLLPSRPGFQSLAYFRHNVMKKNTDIPNAPTGLVTDQGVVWRKLRSTVNPIMLQPKTIKLYKNILGEVAEDMITRMRLIRNEKNILKGDFYTEMCLWSLESIGVVALGSRLNCLDLDLPEDSPEKQLLYLVHNIFLSSDSLDYKPSMWRYIATPAYKKAMYYCDEQIRISKFLVAKAKENLRTKEKVSSEENGILEKLLDIDENIAIIMVCDMFIAGVETVANVVLATLYFLAKNPQIQNKVREETASEQEKQYYLKACIKESMRLMPVATGTMRETTKEHTILGYKIPAKMYIAFEHQTLSVLEENFPRPQEYIPERWLVKKSDPLYHGNAHQFAYSPFGFGVRSCIGRRIAELEMETFLAKVIQNFQVEWFGPKPKIRQSTLNYITGPFNFIFKDIQ